MAQKNEIEVMIPDDDVAAIRGAFGVLDEKLLSKLGNLSVQDRHELLKMGDKTVAFVRKAYENGMLHKELAPDYLDFMAFKHDLDAVELLREFAQRLAPISAALDDSLMLCGSEAYQGALFFYGSVKAAAKAKAPKALAVYEELSARFPGAPTKRRAH